MSITETVKSIAEEAGWSIQEWNGMIKIDADSQNGTWQTFCKILEEEKRFCYYSLCPVNAPKEKIPYMAEVLTRINYGLKVGNFEMDYETGEIHFKTYVDFFGEEDEKPALAQCIYCLLYTSLQGIKGDLSFSLGSLSMTAGVTGGSYDQSGFSVQTVTGNVLALGKNIALSGTELKYSKDAGLDFKTLEGDVGGNVEVFPGFILTGGKISAVKGAALEAGQEENGEAAGGASPISVTVEAGVEAKNGKFSLTAKNTKFTALKDGINDAHIIDAALDLSLIHI